MKIVVIGCGVIGSAVIRELCTEGHDIVAIEENRDILEKAINNFDIAGIEGNGASLEILREAGVDKADLVIATLPYDEVNVLSCLCAKKLGAKEIGRAHVELQSPS